MLARLRHHRAAHRDRQRRRPRLDRARPHVRARRIDAVRPEPPDRDAGAWLSASSRSGGVPPLPPRPQPALLRAALRCAPRPTSRPSPTNANASFGIGDITSVTASPDGRRFFTLGDTAYYNVAPSGGAGHAGTASATTPRGCSRAAASRSLNRAAPAQPQLAAARRSTTDRRTGPGRRWSSAPASTCSSTACSSTPRSGDRSDPRSRRSTCRRSRSRASRTIPFRPKGISASAPSTTTATSTRTRRSGPTCELCFAGNLYVARVRENRTPAPRRVALPIGLELGRRPERGATRA